MDQPLLGVALPHRLGHLDAAVNVAVETSPGSYPCEVGTDLAASCVVPTPAGRIGVFSEAVKVARSVASAARIAVLVPGAAYGCILLEHRGVDASSIQLGGRGQPRRPGTDDHGPQTGPSRRWRLWFEAGLVQEHLPVLGTDRLRNGG